MEEPFPELSGLDAKIALLHDIHGNPNTAISHFSEQYNSMDQGKKLALEHVVFLKEFGNMLYSISEKIIRSAEELKDPDYMGNLKNGVMCLDTIISQAQRILQHIESANTQIKENASAEAIGLMRLYNGLEDSTKESCRLIIGMENTKHMLRNPLVAGRYMERLMEKNPRLFVEGTQPYQTGQDILSSFKKIEELVDEYCTFDKCNNNIPNSTTDVRLTYEKINEIIRTRTGEPYMNVTYDRDNPQVDMNPGCFEKASYGIINTLRVLDGIAQMDVKIRPEEEAINICLENRGLDFNIFEKGIKGKQRGRWEESMKILESNGASVEYMEHEDGGTKVTIQIPYSTQYQQRTLN